MWECEFDNFYFFLHLAYLHVFMFCNFEINRQIVDKLSHNRFTSCTDLRITRIQKHRKNIYFSSFFIYFCRPNNRRGPAAVSDEFLKLIQTDLSRRDFL